MKISVVTVCYNAADTIEKTILSVLNQTYHDIEYIIIDGGSTDGTVEIFRKYADRIAYWVSEPDKGIYDAMNKGIKVATGEWINFMNAGDRFKDESVIEKFFQNRVIDTFGVMFGDTLFIHKNKQRIVKFGDDPHHKIMPSCHQSIFCRKKLLDRNLFDLRYKIAADYNLFFQLRQMDIEFQYVPLVVAVYDATNGISSRNEWSTHKEMLKIESRSLVYFIRVCLLGLKLCIKKILIILKMKK
jgi:glycosyl transferase family protein